MLNLKRQPPSNKKYFTQIQELSELYDDSDTRKAWRHTGKSFTNNGKHDDGCGEPPNLIPCSSSVVNIREKDRKTNKQTKTPISDCIKKVTNFTTRIPKQFWLDVQGKPHLVWLHHIIFRVAMLQCCPEKT